MPRISEFNSTNSKPRVCFIVDERQTRERVQMLHRILQSLRENAHVEVVEGDIPEERFLEKLAQEKYSVIIAPWYRYLQWKKVEAAFGMTRTQGPMFCGYFADQVLPHELADGCDFSRAILLDFNHLNHAEILRLLRAVIRDDQRCGLRPFLRPNTTIYSEDWYSGQGMGTRNDTITAISSSAQGDWRGRANSIRICALALWSLVYDEGPGQESLLQASAKDLKKAAFQFAADVQNFGLRITYNLAGTGAKKLLRQFWPDPIRASDPTQILLRFSDLLRVHVVPETCEIEITLLFFPSAPSEKYSNDVKTFWIEPISRTLLRDTADGNVAAVPPPANAPGAGGGFEAQLKTRERQVSEALIKIRELNQTLLERNQLVNELKHGGVGIAPALAPPDADSLIIALQARIREVQALIGSLEVQLNDAHGRARDVEIQKIEEKLVRMTQREQELILKIEAALAGFRESRGKKRRQAG